MYFVQVNHSGVLGALLQFLTGVEPQSETSETRETDAESREGIDYDTVCEDRLRLFLHVFADMPLTIEWVHSEWFIFIYIRNIESAMSTNVFLNNIVEIIATQ